MLGNGLLYSKLHTALLSLSSVLQRKIFTLLSSIIGRSSLTMAGQYQTFGLVEQQVQSNECTQVLSIRKASKVVEQHTVLFMLGEATKSFISFSMSYKVAQPGYLLLFVNFYELNTEGGEPSDEIFQQRRHFISLHLTS